MDKQLSGVERTFQALSDATRLRILGLLVTGEVCVCEIFEALRISQPKASRHLAYLRKSGLVATRRKGLWVYYRLAETGDPILATIQRAATHVVGHLETVRRDAARLQKKTGCCLPQTPGTPRFACCATNERRR